VFGFVQPIRGTAVVRIEPIFILSRDLREVDELRGTLNGFPGEADVDFGIFPTDPFNPGR
jgi:hypothetical protein